MLTFPYFGVRGSYMILVQLSFKHEMETYFIAYEFHSARKWLKLWFSFLNGNLAVVHRLSCYQVYCEIEETHQGWVWSITSCRIT